MPAVPPRRGAAERVAIIALNVSTLSKRLDFLLSLPFSLFALSEVRLAKPTQASIARRAKSLGFTCIFSGPPPPSPTFAVSPGGTCICAKEELGLRKIQPELLKEWDEKGRLVCGSLAICPQLIIACVYGFPPSHPLRHTNEEMIAQIFHWASSLTCAVLLVGDWNESISSCSALALSQQWGLHRLNGNQPTTRSKNDGPSSTPPIDHAFCNLHALDAGCTMNVSREVLISDHYPLTGHFLMTKSDALAWDWPRQTDLSQGLVNWIPWTNFAVKTLTEWNHSAQSWLAASFGASPVDKNSVRCKPVMKKKTQPDPGFTLAV